jgi:hypothetical protein
MMSGVCAIYFVIEDFIAMNWNGRAVLVRISSDYPFLPGIPPLMCPVSRL